ncbi:prepilin-type N-terminal cleavage/methylation domain-containing protein [Oscillatoria amoena NRMC-F 0135]|uniref:Prepilin-type N-terminal cleavage/methylation domain-containing protein n=1 Tax=Geitlerinema calcuttense NRMC-F 0142 TaxID=2922238 RepID=A0ABT7M0P3_9CYAN|nr:MULTISPECIES: prepilin-type N-terminal cleavage/methylation domain-containing protein [Cyanophyceae]MDL5050591.1 prepilin-type N-terminal cleavage/methylation domain-containing protein [Oscillatoria amoena NRMC-F 0135]MDL5055605.1 prepilin-type N-terminal cleavage/methylation domain-containing protein [Oscillatoria laete-virens NRMC-F 0139]MDL5057828.1 prepilin-type N-terminal cleavage/methylation domain-containing protein [Geitlerinema calcuttense NRMC-F 0142]
MKTQNVTSKNQQRGFSLVEMVVSVAISGMFLSMASLAYVNFYKVFYMQQGYRDIHDDARKAVAIIDRDVRKANTLASMGGYNIPANVSANFSTNFIGLHIPASLDGTRPEEYVLYRLVDEKVRGFDAPVGLLYRFVYTNLAAEPIVQQVTRYPVNIDFSFYKDPGQRATTALAAETAEVRTYLIISNQVTKTISTDRIQVRSKIRNKNIFN